MAASEFGRPRGTLFLDEIADLPFWNCNQTVARLARGRKFERLGGQTARCCGRGASSRQPIGGPRAKLVAGAQNFAATFINRLKTSFPFLFSAPARERPEGTVPAGDAISFRLSAAARTKTVEYIPADVMNGAGRLFLAG